MVFVSKVFFVNLEDDEVHSQDFELTLINLADYHFWTGLQLIPNANYQFENLSLCFSNVALCMNE